MHTKTYHVVEARWLVQGDVLSNDKVVAYEPTYTDSTREAVRVEFIGGTHAIYGRRETVEVIAGIPLTYRP